MNSQPQWYTELSIVYTVEAICGDCGIEIEEPKWYNKIGQEVHITTATVGHYYNDGTVRCESCHEGSR